MIQHKIVKEINTILTVLLGVIILVASCAEKSDEGIPADFIPENPEDFISTSLGDPSDELDGDYIEQGEEQVNLDPGIINEPNTNGDDNQDEEDLGDEDLEIEVDEDQTVIIEEDSEDESDSNELVEDEDDSVEVEEVVEVDEEIFSLEGTYYSIVEAGSSNLTFGASCANSEENEEMTIMEIFSGEGGAFILQKGRYTTDFNLPGGKRYLLYTPMGDGDYSLTSVNSEIEIELDCSADNEERLPNNEKFGLAVLNPNISSDRTKDICTRLLDRLSTKRSMYNRRLKKIDQNKGAVKTRILQNEITYQRSMRIARKLHRLECVDGIDIDYFANQNHIINGDFELKVVAPNLKWDYYSQRQTPGWRVAFLDQDQYCFDDKLLSQKTLDDGHVKGALEIQTVRTGIVKSGVSGDQYAELDSHCVSNKKLDTRVAIFQRAETLENRTYKLTFSAAHRDGSGELTVEIIDLKNKETIKTVVLKRGGEADGKLENRKLTEYQVEFVAGSYLTEIRLSDTDPKNNHMECYSTIYLSC